MAFYVGLDADEVAAGLWTDHKPADNVGNTCGNIGVETGETKAG